MTFDIPAAHDLYRAKVAAFVLTAVGWGNAIASNVGVYSIDSSAVTNGASLLVAVCTLLVSGWIILKDKLYKQEREQRRQDFLDELDRRRMTDEANKTSLTSQVEELKSKLVSAEAEANSDRKKMRDTLHNINNELQNRVLENDQLRKDYYASLKDLATANDRLTHANERLSQAHIVSVAKEPDPVTRIEKIHEVQQIIHDSGAHETVNLTHVAEKVESTTSTTSKAAPDVTPSPPLGGPSDAEPKGPGQG